MLRSTIPPMDTLRYLLFKIFIQTEAVPLGGHDGIGKRFMVGLIRGSFAGQPGMQWLLSQPFLESAKRIPHGRRETEANRSPPIHGLSPSEACIRREEAEVRA